jgi:disulfide bond formation protein DsbB
VRIHPGHARQSNQPLTVINRLRLHPRHVLAGTTLVAGIATAWSLWFSVGLGLIPCDLCWYQRILMYPLTVILGVATYEHRPQVWRTVIPLAVAGGVIAAYQSLLQITATSCAVGGGCGIVQWKLPVLGLTIPNLSLLAFLLILLGASIARELDFCSK